MILSHYILFNSDVRLFVIAEMAFAYRIFHPDGGQLSASSLGMRPLVDILYLECTDDLVDTTSRFLSYSHTNEELDFTMQLPYDCVFAEISSRRRYKLA
jgi:hypothetical protein